MRLNIKVVGLYLILIALLYACDSGNSPISGAQKAPTEALKSDLKPEKSPPKISYPKIVDEDAFLANYAKENPENRVRIKTRLGNMVIRLYDDTPLHRANFIMNVKYGLYENTIFYRVVKDFMVQGGNSDNDETQDKRANIKPYYIPSEVLPHHIHKRGCIAMAMSYTDNPEQESSQYSFYIVTGQVFTPNMIKATELEYGIDIPEANEKAYLNQGGTPHLDGVHTVFGEIIEGMEVLEKIEMEKVDTGDWPVNDVVISMETVSE